MARTPGPLPLEDIILSLVSAGYDSFYEFESVKSLRRSERVDYVRGARAWFDGFWERNVRASTERART